MTDQTLKVGGSIAASATFNADVRTSMTGHFLVAAVMLARAAAETESRPVDEVTEEDKTMHRGLVVGAILQAAAALECEIWEVLVYGPGHHLGSNGIDTDAQALLKPMAEIIDHEPVLERYAFVLHLLRKSPFSRGAQPWQDADLVVRLRNELVHYKSRWGQARDRSKLLQTLQAKSALKPPFMPTGMNFFPYHCLSAARALWGARSCFEFLDSFYARLDMHKRLDPFRQHFE